MTRITFSMLGPRIDTAVTATIKNGRDRKPSVICISTPSSQPLNRPESTAMMLPTVPDTKTARKPTVTEMRAP
jgi:hypothetical protein